MQSIAQRRKSIFVFNCLALTLILSHCIKHSKGKQAHLYVGVKSSLHIESFVEISNPAELFHDQHFARHHDHLCSQVNQILEPECE